MNINYIIIGDSITYGIGDYENNGWAAMFKNYIIKKDDSKSCTNYVHIAGFPGATSSDILDKLDCILQSFINKECLNTVILSIGVNDTQIFNGQTKNNIEQYQCNIENIIKYVTDKKCNLVILGLTRIESNERILWKPNKYYDNNIISEYNNKLKKLCDNNNVKYIPIDVLKNTDYIDGLHPNHKGHIKIYEHILKFYKST